MNQRQVSRYSVIWERLKSDRYIKLSVIPELQPRVIKAIKKRRNLDIAFKFSLTESHSSAKLTFKRSGTIVEVWLRTFTDDRLLTGIGMLDL